MDKTFIFVHGWATDSWVWEALADKLKGSGDIYNINLPGHGGKKRWGEPTLAPAVAEVLRYTSTLNKKSVVGIGWSLGAETLVAAALEDPERFSSLVLTGATPCFVQRDAFTWGQPRALVKRMITDMRKEPAPTVDRFYSLNFTEEELKGEGAKKFIERYKYPGPVVCSVETPGCFPSFRYGEITAALDALYNLDLRSRLKELGLPTLLLHGRMDAIVPVEAAQYMAWNITGASLKVFEDAGHAPFLTKPEWFYAEVKKFIDAV